MSEAGGFSRRTLAEFFTAPLAGDPILPASRAGALRIRIIGLGAVAAAQADERLFRMPEHRPEFAAQNAVRTANGLL